MQPRKLRLIHINDDVLLSWPATWGVPFNEGELQATDSLRLVPAEGIEVPVEMRPLTFHEDGSIRRALISAELQMDAASVREFELIQGKPPTVEKPIQAGSNSVTAACGKLSASSSGIVFETVSGRFDWTFEAAGYFRNAHRKSSPLEWKFSDFECIESGEIESIFEVKGAFMFEGEEVLHARLTMRVFANTPVVLCDFLVLNLSQHQPVRLDYVRCRLSREHTDWSHIDCEVRQRAGALESKPPVAVEARKLQLGIRDDDSAQTLFGRLLNYNETWFAMSDESSRTVIGLRNFYEYFPYNVQISEREIEVEFWPEYIEQPFELAQGAGKTHEFGIGFLGEDDTEWTSRAIGYAIGKPPMAQTPLATYQQGGVFEELLDYLPNQYPRTETTLFDIAYNRNRGYGKMNWGDDYSALYTNQLRGEGEIVWNNLEGDHPYHVWRQFVRTGQYQYFKDYRDSILHWADVDFCDYSDDPVNNGALRIHSARHWTGRTSPCHNWAEGFREWYFSTGHPRPKEILEKMGDWIMRRAESDAFKTDPQPYVRGCGWGLIQMAAIQEVSGRDDIKSVMLKLCSNLLYYCRENDGLVMTMPTGGSWLPRDNAFHTATVVMGAYQTWRLYGDESARELVAAASEAFMDERTCTPEGIAVYITGPEQGFPMQQAATFAIAGLACAYYTTGDERYVRRGMRMLEYCLDRGMIVDHMRIPGEFIEIGDDVILDVKMLMPNTQLSSYQMRGILLFMKAAHDTGMLKEVDYRF